MITNYGRFAVLGMAFAMVFFTSLSKLHADGCFVMVDENRYHDITEPDQKAIIVYDSGHEEMMLQVKFSGRAEQFGWIIPVPSVPTVKKGSIRCFYELSQATEPGSTISPQIMTLGLLGQPGESQEITVHEEKTVGAYDIAVLSAGDSGALTNWLSTHHFTIPPDHRGSIDGYIQKHWCFVAIRISLNGTTDFLFNRSGREPKSSSISTKTRNELKSGELQPLLLSFETPQCVFPLKISKINGTDSRISLYIFSTTPLINPIFYRDAHAPNFFITPTEMRTWHDHADQDRVMECPPAASLRKTFAYFPMLKGTNHWFLTKQARVFHTNEMEDLEFTPALPFFSQQLTMSPDLTFGLRLKEAGPSGVAILEEALTSTDPIRRASAAVALDFPFMDPRSHASLAALRISTNATARELAFTHSSSADPGLVPDLVNALSDSNEKVREIAALRLPSILRLPYSQAARLFADNDPDIKAAAACWNCKFPPDIEIMRRLLTSAQTERRYLAAVLLSKYCQTTIKQHYSWDRQPLAPVKIQETCADAIELAISAAHDSKEEVSRLACRFLSIATDRVVDPDNLGWFETWWARHKCKTMRVTHPVEPIDRIEVTDDGRPAWVTRGYTIAN